MKYHRLYADDSGHSRWAEVEIGLRERNFAPPATAIEVSEPEAAVRTVFLRLRSGWNEPIHTTPVAQRLICLAGRVRVTASDGESREIGSGDVWHMEDTRGRGHHTEVVGPDDFEAVIIQFA
jgi:quercetin dioxygenase-like cupin family protein